MVFSLWFCCLLYSRVCVWTALLLFLMAILNAADIINRFTRIAGELFGMLISVLFIQQAIKVFTKKLNHLLDCDDNSKLYMLCFQMKSQGMVSEFGMPKDEDSKLEKYRFEWLYTNGLLGLIFTFGLLYTALKSRKARSWRYGTGKRDFSSHTLVSISGVKSKRGLKTLISLKRMVQKLHRRLWSSFDGCGLDSIVFQYAIKTPFWCPEKTL